MRQRTVAIAFVAVFLACISTPVRAVDCVEAYETLTAESGDQYVRSCTPSKPREQDIADKRQQPPVPTQVSGAPLVTTQSAQTR